MKLLLSLCLLGSTALFADLHWASNYTKAFADAKEQEKGVMIMLSKEHCDACWYMENIVFDDVNLAEKIETRFVPLYLNINDDNLHDLSFVSTPTLYFMQSSGETIERLDGVYNIKELTAAMLKIKVEKIEEEN